MYNQFVLVYRYFLVVCMLFEYRLFPFSKFRDGRRHIQSLLAPTHKFGTVHRERDNFHDPPLSTHVHKLEFQIFQNIHALSQHNSKIFLDNYKCSIRLSSFTPRFYLASVLKSISLEMVVTILAQFNAASILFQQNFSPV